MPEEPPLEQADGRQMTDEELRLESSDLEDCREVWIGELGEYVMETHKRRKQVEVWFEASVLVSGFHLKLTNLVLNYIV